MGDDDDDHYVNHIAGRRRSASSDELRLCLLTCVDVIMPESEMAISSECQPHLLSLLFLSSGSLMNGSRIERRKETTVHRLDLVVVRWP